MKKFILVLAMLLVAFPGWAKQSFIVEKVLKGDVIQLDNGQVVKLIGVSIPEDKKVISQSFVKRLLEGRRVRLEFDVEEKNETGQTLAYVYIIELFVNASIISAGYASVEEIPPNTQHLGLFTTLYDQAKLNKRGIWQ